MVKMRKNHGSCTKTATIYNMPQFYKIGPVQDHESSGKIRVFSWCLTEGKLSKVRAEKDSKVTKIGPLFMKSESSFGKR